MTNQHPITPPLKLVWEWTSLANEKDGDEVWISITTQAAQWGWDQRGTANEAELQQRADQELEACCEWLQDPDLNVDTYKLRAARRPSPPSLKEQALELLPEIESEDVLHLCPLQVAKSAAHWRLSMTNQHPITPPTELVQQWWEATLPNCDTSVKAQLCTQAARWGADQELDACCEWMAKRYGEESHAMGLLRAARRPTPKPPETIEVDGFTYRLVQ